MITVPQGWTLSYFNDIAVVNPESINSNYDENFQIEYVDISSIENLKISSYELYLLKDAPSRARRIIRNNYILFSTVRPYLKAIAYVDHVGDKNNVVCSTGYAVLKEKTSKSKAKYLYYCVQNDSFLKEVMRVAEGSNYPAISDMEFKRLKLLLPSLPEQQKIAEILSGIDRVIEATQTLIGKEKMIKKGLMADLLNHGIDEQGRIRTPQTHRYIESPLGMIPEGWDVKRLGEIAKINMGQSPDSDFVNKQREGIAFLQGNAEFGEIHPSEKYWVTEPKKVADAGEILVSVRAPVGEINRADKAYCIGRGLASIKINKLVHEYGFYAFSMAKEQLNRLAQGSTFLAISKDDLDVISILIPPKNEQQKIAQILSAQDCKIETEEANLVKLQHLKKGLMADLLSGKVRVKG